MVRRSIAVVLLAVLPGGPLFGQQKPDVDKTAVDVDSKKAGASLVPPDLTMRARVTALTPAERFDINYRYGGEGLGGEKAGGEFGKNLAVGEWSPAVPVASLVKGAFPSRLFLTVSAGKGGRPVRPREPDSDLMEGASTGYEFEFEFLWKNKVIKTIREPGPDGGTVGLCIPAGRLAGGASPESPEFLSELNGLLGHAGRRAALMEKSPWAKGPFPKRFAVVSDLRGYGNGIYYGIRHSNKAILEAEGRALRLLGVNALASPYPFVREAMTRPGSAESAFRRAMYLQLGGYVLPPKDSPEAGCPSAAVIPGMIDEMVRQAVERASRMPVEEVWWRTEDEIGGVTDHSPEGKHHLCVCPRCAESFRAWLKGRGLSTGDFGKDDWAAVAPVNIWGVPKNAAVKAPPPPAAPTDRGTGLAAYYTSLFHIHRSASLFTPVRDALRKLNEEKAKSGAARPFIYSFALRGNTFLMSGHSLDFFEFYRAADNAMVYETSNRDARILGWDSYLCDVGRVLTAAENVLFGVYVKPHRGGPVQRTLAAAGRKARMIYWYTYGPEYVKGDNFIVNPAHVEPVQQAAALLGRSEEALYESAWMVPAEVAVVTPRSSEFWWRMADEASAPAYVAAFENAKWVYTALQHAHIPVDPRDEGMLERADLSRYRVLYVNGINLTRRAAAKVAAWVEAGGTLYTSGHGLVRDEAGQPLAELAPVLGLGPRKPPEMWYRVKPYGAGALDVFDDARAAIAPVPEGAAISGQGLFKGGLKPRIGREVLAPAGETEVLAKFGDGSAAITCRRHGKGRAIVAGFFPGLEYSTRVRSDGWDMTRDFDAGLRLFVTAPALEAVRPVVDASEPLVEGMLVRNAATGRRAVTLANWAYRAETVGGRTVPAGVKMKNLSLAVRGAGEVKRVRSAGLERDLPFSRKDDVLVVSVPELESGDVLMLE